MKLVNGNRQIALEMKQGEVNYLIIESVYEFRNVINELCISVRDDIEDWILSEREEILKKDSFLDIIFSPWMLDINNRKIQKALFKRIMGIIQQGEQNSLISTVMSEIQFFLNDVNNEMPYEFDYELEDIMEIVKACNIHFQEAEDALHRVYQYIRICAEFLNIKLFVCTSIRNYLTDEELDMLAREIGYEGAYILCLENMENGTEKNKVLIDKDLCRVV